jgi:hypothetical protein
MVDSISILAFAHHQYAPRSFDVVADGTVIKRVENAVYREARFWVDLPKTQCETLEIRITDYYPASPAIRELQVFAPAEQK